MHFEVLTERSLEFGSPHWESHARTSQQSGLSWSVHSTCHTCCCLLFPTPLPHSQFQRVPPVYLSSQPSFREVHKDAAGVPLHTLVTVFKGPNRRPTALGGLWHPTCDTLCGTLTATQVQSHCPITFEAHISLRTKKEIWQASLHFLWLGSIASEAKLFILSGASTCIAQNDQQVVAIFSAMYAANNLCSLLPLNEGSPRPPPPFGWCLFPLLPSLGRPCALRKFSCGCKLYPALPSALPV